MSSLFPDDAAEDADTTTAPDRPSAKVVRQLEVFGYRAEAVRRWTPEKANTVLNSCKREEQIALRRADATAKAQGEEFPRGQPTQPERLEAAACIEQAAGRGIEELHQCVAYTIYALSDSELKSLAGYLVQTFREGQ